MSRIIFAFLFLFAFQSYSQSHEEFFRCLINDDSGVLSFIDSEEINYSERFSIQYDNQPVKLLIGYDIEKEIKEGIKSGKRKYTLTEEELGKGYSKTVFSTDNYRQNFYFRDKKLITPIKYFTLNWKKYQSKYFDFLISDELLFNDYCGEKLDEYVEFIAGLLNFSEEEIRELRDKKILYVFCKNQDEIKSITGYTSKGQYIVNTDAVVTTYSCHFHEVSHFLINYKLKTLPLYTLPFIQEGFAVSTGGRGGQSANVLTDVGYYLTKDNIADYRSLFETESFRNEDASISYPVAGLFSKFLLKKNNNKYLNVYKKFSGSLTDIQLMKVDLLEVSILNDFQKYLQNYKTSDAVSFNESGERTKIKVQKSFFLTPAILLKNYSSSKFNEIFKDREYNGEKYYFSVEENEINIYNLYSNELIASHMNSFNHEPVKYFYNDEYTFYIAKSLLDEDMKDLKMSY